jgi:hypothetical protein
MIGFYKIADRVIRVESIYEDVHEYCREYSCEEQTPDFEVKICPEDLIYERKKSEAEAAISPRAFRGGTDGMLETLAVYRKMAESFPVLFDTFLFHGSAIAVDGEAYLFTAKSGTGKSTHTSLWRKYLGDRAEMVNDDKPLIRVSGDEVIIYGTPWNGKHRLGKNVSVPLKALSILERGEVNEIHPISKKEALPMMLQQSYRPAEIKALEKSVQLISKLTENVSLFRLKCNMDIKAAEVAYSAMSGCAGE